VGDLMTMGLDLLVSMRYHLFQDQRSGSICVGIVCIEVHDFVERTGAHVVENLVFPR